MREDCHFCHEDGFIVLAIGDAIMTRTRRVSFIRRVRG
jgi:hypothetical protein